MDKKYLQCEEENISLITEAINEELGIADCIKEEAEKVCGAVCNIIGNAKYSHKERGVRLAKYSVNQNIFGISTEIVVSIFNGQDMNTIKEVADCFFDTDEGKCSFEKKQIFFTVKIVNDRFDIDRLREVIYHELEHYYQHSQGLVNSKTTKKSYAKSLRWMKDENNAIETYQKGELPNLFIGRAIYLSNDDEINAFANQSYAKIMNLKKDDVDCTILMEDIKKTELYKALDELTRIGILIFKSKPSQKNIEDLKSIGLSFDKLKKKINYARRKMINALGKVVVKASTDKKNEILNRDDIKV